MAKLKIGESKKIWLEKEGVGGYTWRVQSNSAPEVAVTEKSKDQPEGTQVPGTSAGVWFAITAVKKGTTKVIFELVRSWETPATPAKTTTVIVQVA